MTRILSKLKLATAKLLNQKLITVIILSWNRPSLLKICFHSLRSTARLPLKIIIIDNNSNAEVRNWLSYVEEAYDDTKVIFVDKNLGGKALDLAKARVSTPYVLFSEDDLEYKDNWDINMLEDMMTFKKLGQISPFSPFPERDFGEVWKDKPYEEVLEKGSNKVYLSPDYANIGTSCLVKTELYQKCIRKNIEKNGYKFPDDGDYTRQIRNHGFEAAWSNAYRVINWGHNLATWVGDKEYYLNNYRAKDWVGEQGLAERLKAQGIDPKVMGLKKQ